MGRYRKKKEQKGIRVDVRNNNVEWALKKMKRMVKDSGMMLELKRRTYYKKPSEEKREIIKSLVSKVAQVINIPFTVGGGVKTLQHARDILLSGADKVAINTGAVKNPQIISELMELFGRQCIVVAIDVKRNYNIKNQKNIFSINDKKFWFEVFIYGGKKETGLDAIDWAK